MTDVFDKATRSRIMSKIRSTNTTPEILLRKVLRGAGFRFSVHPKLPGTPDIAFKKQKVAVFVDGEFWHGYNWKKRGIKPTNGFWKRKITRNIARDKRVNRELRKNRWKVMRFWEGQVLKKPNYCIARVGKAVSLQTD